VLGIFFMLVWVTVIAALTSHERNRSTLLLAESGEDEAGTPFPSDDPALLVRYYRVALSRTLPLREEQLLRINFACALNATFDHRAALEELDKVQLATLSPQEGALWLNNRAYTLVFLSQPDDAIGHIEDAFELLHGDDGAAKDPLLAACLSGTRGIAELHQKNYRAAEASLLAALRGEEESVTLQFDPEWQIDPSRTAERWFWLAEIARAENAPMEARRRYERAAAFPSTPFGRRAKAAISEPAVALPEAPLPLPSARSA
jgi:tetratricopeptide (TPR) repeat protein